MIYASLHMTDGETPVPGRVLALALAG